MIYIRILPAINIINRILQLTTSLSFSWNIQNKKNVEKISSFLNFIYIYVCIWPSNNYYFVDQRIALQIIITISNSFWTCLNRYPMIILHWYRVDFNLDKCCRRLLLDFLFLTIILVTVILRQSRKYLSNLGFKDNWIKKLKLFFHYLENEKWYFTINIFFGFMMFRFNI